MLTRRQFLKRGAAGAGGVMLGNALLQAGAASAVAPTANLADVVHGDVRGPASGCTRRG
jgi:anaerobic selenocysteine-containing dehydrogenase